MTKNPYFLPMHQVVFVVYPGFELLDLSGPVSAFNHANRAVVDRSRRPHYAFAVVSSEGGPVASSSGVTVDTQEIADLRSEGIGTLLIAGAEREPLLRAIADRTLQSTLPGHASAARRFGSVCTGTFVLAALGLLDGHRVATHWDACKPLARSYPAIEVDPDALYVEEGKVWTSAGVTTGIDMALAMIARDLGAAIASDVAKRLVLYARRPGNQSQFSPLLLAQAKADSPFADLLTWMQANLNESLDVAHLAERAGLSERTFHRRFVAALGDTPARFVESIRLDAARLLLSRGLPLKSVAAQVGLFPATRLSEAFQRRYGVSPQLFRELHDEKPLQHNGDLHTAT